MADSLRTPLLRRIGPALANRSWPWSVPLRRVLAGALFVLAIVLALLPHPAEAGPRRAVVTATRDLASGSTVRARDIRVRRLPDAAVAGGALQTSAAASGKRLAGAVRAGEQLTDARLVEGIRTGRGRAAVPVRLADPAVAELLHPGTVVDVLAGHRAGSGAHTLARAAKVVTVPRRRTGHSGDGKPGDDPKPGGDGKLVVLALPAGSAHQVAASSLERQVTVTLR